MTGWTLEEENDTFAFGNASDEAYTQGLRVGYTLKAKRDSDSGLRDPLDRWLSFACRHRLPWMTGDLSVQVLSQDVALGQNFFTPGDIAIPTLIEDDRPYASWFYTSLHTLVMEANDSFALYHDITLQVGVVGPAAFGHWTQSHFHRLLTRLGSQTAQPQGWGHQLPNEPGFFGTYRLTLRPRPWGPAGWQADLLPHAEVALGTVQDFAEAGVVARTGRNLTGPQTLYNEPAIFSFNAGPDSYLAAAEQHNWFADDSAEKCWGWLVECYVGVGASIRAVARNEFLDGTLFSDSHHVSHEPIVYDLMAIARLRFKYVSVDFSYIRRSKEFSPVPSTAPFADGHHDFGAIGFRCTGDAALACPAFVGLLIGAMGIL